MDVGDALGVVEGPGVPVAVGAAVTVGEPETCPGPFGGTVAVPLGAPAPGAFGFVAPDVVPGLLVDAVDTRPAGFCDDPQWVSERPTRTATAAAPILLMTSKIRGDSTTITPPVSLPACCVNGQRHRSTGPQEKGPAKGLSAGNGMPSGRAEIVVPVEDRRAQGRFTAHFISASPVGFRRLSIASHAASIMSARKLVSHQERVGIESVRSLFILEFRAARLRAFLFAEFLALPRRRCRHAKPAASRPAVDRSLDLWVPSGRFLR